MASTVAALGEYAVVPAPVINSNRSRRKQSGGPGGLVHASGLFGADQRLARTRLDIPWMHAAHDVVPMREVEAEMVARASVMNVMMLDIVQPSCTFFRSTKARPKRHSCVGCQGKEFVTAMSPDMNYYHPELIYSVNLHWYGKYKDFCNSNGKYNNRFSPAQRTSQCVQHTTALRVLTYQWKL